jgi:peptidyl-prolyl cis-trans isomerase SurA
MKAFREEVKKQDISWTLYRNQIHKQLLVARLQQEAIGQTVNVTSADIANFKQQYAAHQKQQAKYNLETIVIPFLPMKELSSAAQAAKAKALVTLLREKTSLNVALNKIYGSKLAKDISPESQQLGLRTKDELPDLFQDVVIKMKVGQYAGPIKAPNGFHILHLIGENKTQRNLTKAEITRLIYQQKFEEALKQWLKGLRKSAYVKIINHKSS